MYIGGLSHWFVPNRDVQADLIPSGFQTARAWRSVHLFCQSWKTDVPWEEVERFESALLVFSATTDSFKTVSWQRGFDTGYGLPARK